MDRESDGAFGARRRWTEREKGRFAGGVGGELEVAEEASGPLIRATAAISGGSCGLTSDIGAGAGSFTAFRPKRRRER